MCESVEMMAVKFALRKVVARKNLERANDGLPPYTQTEIAAGSGVSQSVVSKLLTGRSSRIDLATINGLCDFLQVLPGDLFEYIPDEN